MPDILLLFIGCFIGSMIYQTIRDYRFYKRHRITTPESDRMVRSWSFTPGTNVIDALAIAAVITFVGHWVI